MTARLLDAWVQLTDYEQGGDACWMVDPDDLADCRIWDAEGELLATATTRAAAETIVELLNAFAQAVRPEDETAARGRRFRCGPRPGAELNEP